MERKLEILLAVSFDFSIEIIKLCKELIDSHNTFFSRPLYLSTTKMSVNINEAIEFHSNRTFLAKLADASSQAHETLYWLKRIERDHVISYDMHKCINHCELILHQLSSASYSQAENPFNPGL
jgi:four helix bundle protein